MPDRRAAPWFALVWLAGFAWLGFFFVAVWLPGTALLGGWVVLGL